jgi:DNA helicase-2/ATP-dependent DNA helicase PcrA
MSEILNNLNPEQKQAVTTTEGPLLIIAGAGTGKTTVISRRIAYLIEKKLAKPSEILALTFTEKAAAEMEERVDLLVPYGYIDTWISTFHAFGDRVLKEKALEIGLPSDFQVLTKPQQILFVQQNLFAFNLKHYRPLANPTKFIEAMLSLISRAKDEDVGPEDYSKFVKKLGKAAEKTEAEKQSEISQFYKKYEELKESSGKVDYGDQVQLVLKLFRAQPSILKEYQKKFRYILVDEYQDTNHAQNELVKLLSATHKNIAVVGDDDQSIYKFRGAAVSNILKFKNDHRRAKQIVLTKNYRSNQAILDTAYRLIRFNDPDRLEFRNKISKRLKSLSKEEDKAPKEIAFETISQEADWVANEIEKLTSSKKLQFKDAAILVRANSIADTFLRSLNLKQIPYKFSGLSGLYNQPEIKLLISFLKTIAHFEDSLSLYDLATSEIYQLKLEDCIVCMDSARRTNKSLRSIFQNLPKLADTEVSSEGKAIVEKILADQEELLNLSKKENVGKVLYRFLEKTLYLTRLERENSIEAQLKIQNIAKFFDKIKEFIDLSKNESVQIFVDYLSTMQQVGDDPAAADYEPDLDAVSVLTVHAAKGLEFNTVFMVGLTSDRFPARERGELIKLPDNLIKEDLPEGDFHVQEERRLFYVGTTRAKSRLYYTWAVDSGGKRVKKISPFILEALDKPMVSKETVRKTPLEKIQQFRLADRQIKKVLPARIQNIIRLSQASVDDYETCAYKYRYAHVLRLPILRHHTVVYGFAIHSAIAAFWRTKIQRKKPKVEKLYEVLENTWVNEGFLTAKHEEMRLIQAKAVVKSFWEREKDNQELPSFIEKEFRFTLKKAKLEIIVNGRYDRLDVKGGEAEIIDYKTTENRTLEELEKVAKSSIQLKIYTLAYLKNYGKLPKLVAIEDLETGLRAGFEPNLAEVEKTEEDVIRVALEIQENLQKDNFSANPKYFGRTPACFYCPYSSICPFSLTKVSSP